MTDDRAEQIALALLRLAELDDTEAVQALVDDLTPDELRAVMVVQTTNLAQAFAPWSIMHGLSVVAVEHSKPFGEVRQDYLYYRLLRMAGAKRYEDES